MTTSRNEKRIRRSIWIQSAIILSLWAMPIWAILRFLYSHHIKSLPSIVGLGLLLALSSWIFLLLAFLFSFRLIGSIQAHHNHSIEPVIRQLLTEHIGGKNLTEQFCAAYKKHSRIVEKILVQALSRITGGPYCRIRQLADDLRVGARLEHRYCSRRASVRRDVIGCLNLCDDVRARNMLVRALKDREGRIAIDASRALARFGGRTEIENVFRFASSQPLLIRALLAEDLRPYASILNETCIPQELTSGEPSRIMNVLEFLNAWQVSLPLPSFPALLAFPDPMVHAASFRVLHYAGTLTGVGVLVENGLHDANAGVQVAAAIAAGRFQLESAIPLLKEIVLMESGNPALASAMALSELGESGVNILEEIVSGGNLHASAVAMEALERVRIGRHDYARH
jgi:hypothetical protein